MNVKVEKLENHKVSLDITVPSGELEKAYDVAYKRIAQKVNIPGFRKGKAPRKIVENNVGKEYITEEAFKIVYRKAFSDAAKENDLIPVSQIDLEPITVELGKDTQFKTSFVAKPEAKLGEYKGLKIPKFEAVVTDDDVESKLAEIQKRRSHMEDAEEGSAVANGDFITLDFKGTVDGVAFTGGESKDYPLEIGSGSFIPGFEDQLIGMKVGDEKDVIVTFPDDYHAEDLKGKEAKFECKVNSIKHNVLPELNDEFAKTISTFQSMTELRDDIRKNLVRMAENKMKGDKREAVLDAVIGNAEVDVPDAMIENRIDTMIQKLAGDIAMHGMTMEQYVQMTGTDLSKVRENFRETAEKNVRADLVLEAVAKAENITLADGDLEAEIGVLAKQHEATPAQITKVLRENDQMDSLVGTIIRRKAMTFLEEVSVESEEA